MFSSTSRRLLQHRSPLLLTSQQTFRHFNSFIPASSHTSTPPPQSGIAEPRSKLRIWPFFIVPQGEVWIKERFGRFQQVLTPGIGMLIPLVDSIPMKFSTKEIAHPIGYQTAITKDNVHLKIDGVVFYRIVDPVKASYEISNAHHALVQLAQSTMRAEIGKIELDKTFSERQMLNTQIVEQIQKTAEGWGVSVLRYEIMNIDVPKRIEESMELEAEAERNKRKTVLESMAQRDRLENIATGEKIARILNAEAEKIEQERLAEAEAYSIQRKADATADAISRVAEALAQQHGSQAVSYHIARDYIEAFSRLAKEGNTLIVPANVGDASGMIAQAASVFGNVYKSSQASGIGAPTHQLQQSAASVLQSLEGNTGTSRRKDFADPSANDDNFTPISPEEAAKRLEGRSASSKSDKL